MSTKSIRILARRRTYAGKNRLEVVAETNTFHF